ncbi:hypothetical protein N7481_000264 [Penicillium waksmanii]|uniref:uncharacterized protein n=1 Tax=Penicillium waksmanii TaxID=69791 RepID=UPI00254670A9|nr:uncharacterized protein N7481_000264 [Penicillium waksmanii]KAJ5999855.1 hypothetical protein N7481_000264 [Penicillium waksmanii]
MNSLSEITIGSEFEEGYIEEKNWNGTRPIRRYNSPLALASHRGHDRVIEKLLSYGGAGLVNLRYPGRIYVRSPLFYAIDSGHRGVVKMLLNHGANAHANSTGESRRCFWIIEPDYVAQLVGELSRHFLEPSNRLKTQISYNLMLHAGADEFETLDEFDKRYSLHSGAYQEALELTARASDVAAIKLLFENVQWRASTSP